MPRGKKSKKSGTRRGGADSGHPTDEEYDTSDTRSVISSHSEPDSIIGAEGADDEIDESSAQENFEDKLKDCIDGLTQKSAKGRTDCLKNLRAALQKKYIYEFIVDRKLTILDCLEKCLKKGKGEEQAVAAGCVTLLVIQLGTGVDAEEVYKSIRPVLQIIMNDNSVAPKTRSACAEALGMCSFLACGDLLEAIEVMKLLHNIFKGSFLKGNGAAPTHNPDVYSLHANALAAWTLLLSIAPASSVEDFIDSHLPKLPELLSSPDLDVRIATGEAIALLYELARESDEMFYGDDIDDLCDTLKQLATDGNKYRAKKDRRQQRSSFRDILHTVEEGDAPSYSIRFGQEVIHLDSWSRKRQYDALCHSLATGMNVHLQENDLVRDIFGLGAPIPVGAAKSIQTTKFERKMYNAAAFKALTKSRSKHRDKRTVMLDS